MIKLATDENFDGDILRGLLRRLPEVDVVRVQDAELAATPDTIPSFMRHHSTKSDSDPAQANGGVYPVVTTGLPARILPAARER